MAEKKSKIMKCNEVMGTSYFYTKVTVMGTSYFLTKGTVTVMRYNIFVTSNALLINIDIAHSYRMGPAKTHAIVNL